MEIDLAAYEVYYAGDHLVLRHARCSQVVATEWKTCTLNVLLGAAWDHAHREYRA